MVDHRQPLAFGRRRKVRDFDDRVGVAGDSQPDSLGVVGGDVFPRPAPPLNICGRAARRRRTVAWAADYGVSGLVGPETVVSGNHLLLFVIFLSCYHGSLSKRLGRSGVPFFFFNKLPGFPSHWGGGLDPERFATEDAAYRAVPTGSLQV
jgi:hypothetical protein